jgi:hypothetical protein
VSDIIVVALRAEDHLVAASLRVYFFPPGAAKTGKRWLSENSIVDF